MGKYLLKDVTVTKETYPSLLDIFPTVNRVALINGSQINAEIQNFKDKFYDYNENDIVEVSCDEDHILYIADSDNYSDRHYLRIDKIEDMT
jgi:hypothetical protein